MNRLLLLCCFFITLTTATYAQTATPSCAQTLRLAQSVYEQGRLHEIPGILQKCIDENGFTKQEKVNAFKILTNTYIYLEEPEQADESMLKILQTDPYFQINEAIDPAEFVALYKTFRTTPIYRLGVKLGVNASQPNITELSSAVELTKDSNYKYNVGILFGGIFEVPLKPKMTIHSELLYLQRKFEVNLMVDRGTNLAGNPLSNEFNGIETQNWISAPITFEYKIMEKKYNPYVAGGVSVDYLLGDKLKGLRSRTDAAAITETTFELKPQREKINISAIAAAGVKMKVGGGFFVAELRYLYGITPINSRETAFANELATWDQGYADPVFKLSSLSVTGSYIINIFSPKKKTSKK